MAPGGILYSLTSAGTRGPGINSYGENQGTSFAAPLAAGVASLMFSLNPMLTPAQLMARLRAGVRPHVFDPAFPLCSNGNSINASCNCTTSTCGAGLLDANYATQLALGPAAIVVPLGQVAAGTAILLDGRGSAASDGATLVDYQWTQLAGPAVLIQNANTALASVALPAQADGFVFRLVVRDSSARTSEDQLSVTSVGSANSGRGGGSIGWLWGTGLWLLAGLAWRRCRPCAGHFRTFRSA